MEAMGELVAYVFDDIKIGNGSLANDLKRIS